MGLLAVLAERTFEGVARLRRGRALHPRGTLAAATWVVDEPASALGRTLGTGAHQVVVRLSRGLGLPPPLPDVHGVAVQLRPVSGRVDLLFSGSARRLSTLLPYRTDDGGLVLLELRGTAPGSFLLRERALPGAARTVGRLVVGEPRGDDPVPSDPYRHQHPGLRPVRLLASVREAAYAGSRRGRCR